ncbi:MAG TPA: hypothetical protein PL009_13595 [Flavipsychrobacter sp.]|nr:hypothetical protein [Flavipsychrobacter sp.]
MNTGIKYLWGKDHLLIDLGNRIQSRIRIIYWIEFVITMGIATIILLELLSLNTTWFYALASISISLLYLLAAYRFFSRMSYREKIRVTDQDFTIIKQTPFRHKETSYVWTKMGVLHYKGKEAKTDHPLKGKCFDYFGFDTQEKLVQDLHHDGNLYFNYCETSVRFARGIYSWHAEEIVRMIRIFSGTSLQLGEEWEYLLEEMNWMNK